MAKTIKVIDLLNRMANNEELPKKVLILDEVYYLLKDDKGNMMYSQSKELNNWEAYIDRRLNLARCLNEDVIILDDETEKQEDIDYWEEIANTFRKYGETLAEKFAKIGRQIDKNKQDKE